MKSRRGVLVAVLALVGLPVLVAGVEAVSFHARTRGLGSTIVSGDGRESLLHVPESYDPRTPTPLVVSLHGGATSPAQQAALSGWNRLADEHGFIVVYPPGHGFPKRWGTFSLGPRLFGDASFVAGLIESLESEYNIDPTRIYASGMSNGGGMAFVLSCTLPDRIAAVGLVAPAQDLPPEWCLDTRPVPMIAFHGDADPILPYEGGPLGRMLSLREATFPAIRDFVARWARRNRCAAGPVESTVAEDVTRHEYAGCAGDADVVLYTIHGGGHTWPGGEPLPEWFAGPTSDSIEATRRMWAFFREHPYLPR